MGSVGMGRDAFISYANQDKATADAVVAALELAGLTCWIAPRNVPAGTSYPEQILIAIEEASIVVLLLTEHANNSDFVRREIERAASKRKPILPVQVDGVLPSRQLELFVGERHWFDATRPPLEDRLRELAGAAKELRDGKASEPSGGGDRLVPLLSGGARSNGHSRGRYLTAGVVSLLLVGAGAVGLPRLMGGAVPQTMVEVLDTEFGLPISKCPYLPRASKSTVLVRGPRPVRGWHGYVILIGPEKGATVDPLPASEDEPVPFKPEQSGWHAAFVVSTRTALSAEAQAALGQEIVDLTGFAPGVDADEEARLEQVHLVVTPTTIRTEASEYKGRGEKVALEHIDWARRLRNNVLAALGDPEGKRTGLAGEVFLVKSPD